MCTFCCFVFLLLLRELKKQLIVKLRKPVSSLKILSYDHFHKSEWFFLSESLFISYQKQKFHSLWLLSKLFVTRIYTNVDGREWFRKNWMLLNYSFYLYTQDASSVLWANQRTPHVYHYNHQQWHTTKSLGRKRLQIDHCNVILNLCNIKY